MDDPRRDPQRILDRLREAEGRAARGRLKIFFGASAGVGKTYAMLCAAHQQRAQGVDVVVGVVESHGRRETAALLDGLDVLPPRSVAYKGRTLAEFDIDGALARQPALILVDELAHSNVEGSRHPKRWQDVEELLDAGIDVYTTVNVQHLETLNDVVGGITGVRVWETVPDHVFDAADEVVLVDLPPDELLQRLKEGKVYLPQQAERAIQNFFRKGNLIALRELALRRTADRVDSEMVRYRRDSAVSTVWATQESLLACVGPGEGGDRVVRACARLAGRLEVPWHAIYVETPDLRHLSERNRQRILKNLHLAQESGAETASLAGADAAERIAAYARDHNLARIVVGRDHPRGWRPWHRSMAEQIGRQAPDLDVILVARDEARRDAAVEAPTSESWLDRLRAPWTAFAMTAALGALATVVATLLLGHFDLANIAMVFLLAVVLTAVRYGLGPAVVASFLNVAAFDYFFVPPRFSFAVSDVQYVLTFAVMLASGLITANLTAGLKLQARVASRREYRIRALYEMSRDLSGALMPEQIAEIALRFSRTTFAARCTLVLADDANRLLAPLAVPGGLSGVDAGICQWAFDHEAEAGCGTDTLPASPLLYVPLKAPMRIRGVLVLEPRHPGRMAAPEQHRLLETFARLIAISLERVHYIQVAQATTLQMESERLRNSLLSAISHDLRTPLSALVGLVDMMLLTRPAPAPALVQLAESMRDEVQRMNALVSNLLDMARLQAGTVTLNKQWQPLEEVVGSALKGLESALFRHPVEVRLPDDLPLLEFDTVLIERVLSNLVENAVKYTPPGTPVRIGAEGPAGGFVTIWVEDDGPGLPAGREEAIFKKFERGQSESATPGVGLGLAICRAIVAAHGGTIRAENRADGGARFLFSLPAGQPPAVPGMGGLAEDAPHGH